MRADDSHDVRQDATDDQLARAALVEVTSDLAESYLAMVAEFEAAGEGYPFNDAELAQRDFAAFANDLRNESLGIGLPPGIVPQTTYVLLDRAGQALGELRFRPRLTPPFEQHNGHIGYNVRPRQRGHGVATRMLALALGHARALRLEALMLPVEGENPASARVIEKNGGVLERHYLDDSGTPVAIYWITLLPL
jgi:predicted acetyltransferase